MKNEILNAIDVIDTTSIIAEMDVLEALSNSYEKADMILEYYTGDDVEAFSIFQEAKQDTQKKESKFMVIIKRIRDAIAKMVATIFKKMGCSGFDPDMVGVTTTPQKIETEIKKVEKFSKKHPFVTGLSIAVGGTGAVYGTMKGVKHIEKSVALKSLDDSEKEIINKSFDQTTRSFKLPFDVARIIYVSDECDKRYGAIRKTLYKSLYGSETSNTQLTQEKVDDFIKSKDGLAHIKKMINDMKYFMAEKETMSFESRKTYCKDIKEYNRICDDFNNSIGKVNTILVSLTAIGDILWNVQTMAPENMKESVGKDCEMIYNHLQKSTRVFNGISDIENEYEKITSTLNKFLPKYYAAEQKATAIAENIGKAASYTARVYKAVSDIKSGEYNPPPPTKTDKNDDNDDNDSDNDD